MAKAYVRKNYLVKHAFQFKYTLLTVMLLFAIVTVTGTAFYIGMVGSVIENFSKFRVSEDLEAVKMIADRESGQYAKQDYNFLKMFREAALLSDRQSQMIEVTVKDINKRLLPKLLLLSVAMIIAGIFISHRVAGPMYRIEQSAEALRQGDLRGDFKIRKSDEMQETAMALNDMTKSLRQDIEDAKKAAAALETKASSLTGRLPENDVNDIRTLVGEISAALSRYKL